MSPKVRPTTTRVEIWFAALTLTAAIWFIGTFKLMEVPDQILSSAIGTAAVSALSGLIPWTIYHAVSRQNNGGAILVVAFLQMMNSSHRIALPFEEEFSRCAMTIASLGAIAFVIGLLARGLRKAMQHRLPETRA